MTEFPVTRKEYDELFLAMTRLTDRIEALEATKRIMKLDQYGAAPLRDIDLDSMVLYRADRS